MSKSIFIPISKIKEDRASFQGAEHTCLEFMAVQTAHITAYLSLAVLICMYSSIIIKQNTQPSLR